MGKEWPKVQLMPFQFFLLTLNFIRQPISIGIHKGKDRHLIVWIKINVIAWRKDIRSIVWRILAKLFISQHQLCISHFQNIDSSFLIKNLHKTITWKWVIEHLLCRWGSHLIKGLGRQVSSSLRYSNILIFFSPQLVSLVASFKYSVCPCEMAVCWSDVEKKMKGFNFNVPPLLAKCIFLFKIVRCKVFSITTEPTSKFSAYFSVFIFNKTILIFHVILQSLQYLNERVSLMLLLQCSSLGMLVCKYKKASSRWILSSVMENEMASRMFKKEYLRRFQSSTK